MVTDCDTYGDACDPVAGRSKMRRDLRLSIFSILPFPLGENTRGRISERSGNVEGPGAFCAYVIVCVGAWLCVCVRVHIILCVCVYDFCNFCRISMFTSSASESYIV